MSLYGAMRTSTSGMAGQSNRISTVAENVANANTTGYKHGRTEFSSLIVDTNAGNYNSGSVAIDVRRFVSSQGNLAPTNSLTDLAIKGGGFFIVQDQSGANVMTRAGGFVPDDTGNLVNAGGFNLMGYRLDPEQPSVVVNGFNGLVPVALEDLALTAEASTQGNFQANLPSTATVLTAANLPSANAATSTFTAKSSLMAYGNLGEQVLLDVYFAKTGSSTWEVSVFDNAGAQPGTGFTYAGPALTTSNVVFDANGLLAASSPQALSIAVPGGATLDLDISKMSQLASPYSVQSAALNGNAASTVELVEIDRNGFVHVGYEDGKRQAVFRIPLANVASPDNLEPRSGSVFQTTSQSGAVQIGFPGEGGRGEVISSSLEQSTVDLASELTDMIDAQRGYTANSKVFQTGAELMDVLVNLKR
jgi:flagellar hook protein FlgE